MAVAMLAVLALWVIALFFTAHTNRQVGEEGVAAEGLLLREGARLKSAPLAVLETYATTPPAAYALEVAGTPYTLTCRVERRSSTPADLEYKLLDLSLDAHWMQRRELRVGSGQTGSSLQSTHLLQRTTISALTNH